MNHLHNDPTSDMTNDLIQEQTRQAVDEAITSRHSIRAFLPTPIPRETIEAIL